MVKIFLLFILNLYTYIAFSQVMVINISSDPKGANMLITNSNFKLGVTPERFKLEKNQEVVIFQDNYYTASYNIGTPGLFNKHLTTLVKYNVKFGGKKTPQIALDKISFNVAKNKFIGSSQMGIGSKWTEPLQKEMEKLCPSFLKESEDAFSDDSINIYVKDNTLQASRFDTKYYVSAEIIDIWVVNNDGAVAAMADVNWHIYDSRKSKILLTVNTKGAVKSTSATDCFKKCFYNAARGVSQDEKFTKFMLEENVSAASDPVKEFLYIENIKPISNVSPDDLLSLAIESVVTIKTEFGHGSGVIITSTGGILTNYHVIEGAKKVEVIFSNGFTLEAQVIKVHDGRDVAFIKVIAGSGYKAITLDLSEKVSTGTEVFAIGTPEDISLGQTVTKGIISGKRQFKEVNYIQTDVSLNSGNSGGPLINNKGIVIGLVVAKVKQLGTEGLGFAIPIKEALDALDIKIKY